MRVQKNNKKSNMLNKEQTVNVEKTADKMTMLSSIETILLKTEDSKLSPKCLEPLKPHFKYISELQGITNSQALLLSIFLEESSGGCVVSISDLARFLDCNNVRVMQYQDDIDDMVNRKMLRKLKKRYSPEGMGYVVPQDVIKAIKSNIRFVPKPLTAKDGIHFFQMLFNLTHQRYENEIEPEQLMEDFQQLLEANDKLSFVKKLERLNLPLNSQLIVAQIARHLILHQENFVTPDNLKFLFEEHDAYFEINQLQNGKHILMKKNLVEFEGENEFMSNTRYKLTNAAKEKLLKGFSLPKKTKTNIQAIKADSISEKTLFFNNEIGQQMDELSELLSVERLTAIQTRLKEHGRRAGFACLFYGSPGTGKTESVLQIARKTGRDIMQVDVSEIKSMWVGESEKNIKAVFDNYRALCKNSDMMPILLFNEADAILGTRKGEAVNAVDKMENSIQNIVLQEMETLDGIMIATTNLEQNLDNAFERRFIYKIRFDRPDVESRRKIWQSMMPTLSDDTALQLAASFDLSGGQIENIVRKCDVESILYGESSVDDDKIQRFCQEEKILKPKTSRIGFV